MAGLRALPRLKKIVPEMQLGAGSGKAKLHENLGDRWGQVVIKKDA
jgi:hypothetical protein